MEPRRISTRFRCPEILTTPFERLFSIYLSLYYSQFLASNFFRIKKNEFIATRKKKKNKYIILRKNEKPCIL